MFGRHVLDPEFANSSSELKRILSSDFSIPSDFCVDIPCGNGRNIFLLATYFREVIGIDINPHYLADIEECKTNYSSSRGDVLTQKMGIVSVVPDSIKYADFISTIHFYNYTFISKIINDIKKGAFFYIETPSCAGKNYLELPSEKEVAFLMKEMEILLYKNTVCKSPGQHAKSISFKLLLKK